MVSHLRTSPKIYKTKDQNFDFGEEDWTIDFWITIPRQCASVEFRNFIVNRFMRRM